MMESLLSKFIQTYNDLLSVMQIQMPEMDIRIIEKKEMSFYNHSYSVVDNLYLNYATNYSYMESNFEFLPSQFKHNVRDWVAFGHNSQFNLFYVLDESGEVIAINDDDYDIHWKCSKDANGFFNALSEYFKSEIIRRTDVLTYTDEFKKTVLNNCIELAGGVKYSEFYKHIIGV